MPSDAATLSLLMPPMPSDTPFRRRMMPPPIFCRLRRCQTITRHYASRQMPRHISAR